MAMPAKRVASVFVQKEIGTQEGVVLVIIRQGEIPPVENQHFVRQREIELLLGIFVIGRQEPCVVVPVMGVVIGILDEQACVPSVEPPVLPLRLHKGVAVPEALTVLPDVIDNRSRYAALGIVVVEMEAPETRGTIVMMKPQLGTHGIDISVLADSRGVIRRLTRRQDAAVAERVFAGRIDILGIEG